MSGSTNLPAASSNVLTVGTDGEYKTLAAAADAAVSGDTIDVQAGTYTNDFATVNGGGSGITVQAVGGTVNEVATVPPPNGKALLDESGNVTVNGFSFSGVSIPNSEGGNGAGIRYENGNLTLNNVSIHDNQDGLLANGDPNGTITINNSTIANNGTGTGYTHDLYVNGIANLTINGSTVSGANGGHEIKSRAASTTVTNSTIEDGPNGNSSYLIDTPNGGNVTITGDTLDKGPNSGNPILVSSGEEGNNYASNSLNVSNDTIVNNLHRSSSLAVMNDGPASATVSGNQVSGLTSSELLSGSGTASGNTILGSISAAITSAAVSSPGMSFIGGSGSVPAPASTGITASTSNIVQNPAGSTSQASAGSLSGTTRTSSLHAGYMALAGHAAKNSHSPISTVLH